MIDRDTFETAVAEVQHTADGLLANWTRAALLEGRCPHCGSDERDHEFGHWYGGTRYCRHCTMVWTAPGDVLLTGSCDTCQDDEVPIDELHAFNATSAYPEGETCTRCQERAEREMGQ